MSNIRFPTIELLLALLMSFSVTRCRDKASAPGVSTLPANNKADPSAGKPLDKSPMDMIYLPPDYPILKMMGKAQTSPYARIIYSRPQRNGRRIFGEVARYSEFWRMGANEATELEVFRTIQLAGKPVEPGRYVLYCIPEEARWTIAVNRDIHSWGLRIDQSLDLIRFNVPVQKLRLPVDVMTMEFVLDGRTAQLLIAWDDAKVSIPVSLPQ